MFRQSFILIATALSAAFASTQFSVTTYHYDKLPHRMEFAGDSG